MHRNRTWTLNPPEWRTQRNRLLPIEGGDGSTLNLDFTTGVLDPRLTFRRAGTATFVNSSGYVDHAGANLLFQGSNLGNATNWFGNGLTSRNASPDPNGSNEAVELNEDATNTVHAVIQVTSQNFNGLVYTLTVYMKAGTNRTIGFMRDNNVSSDATVFYTLTGSGTATIANGAYGIVASINAVGEGWYRCVLTIKGAYTANVTIGTAKGTAYLDWSFAGTVGNSIHVWGAQLNPGSTAQTYYPTTTAAYHAPRFDYSPTNIGEPRGLLIEGQAINIATRSDDFAETPSDGANWTNSSYTTSFLSTSLPNGSTGNARRIVITSGAASFRSNSLTVNASTQYTFSFWARNNGGSQARYRVWNLTAGSSIVDYNSSGSNYVSSIGGANNTSSTWVRISVTFTTPAGCTSILVYPMSSDSGTVDLLVWGAQLELGSGASSYIPTGASQVTRNAELLAVTSTTTMGLNTSEGTFFVETELPRGGLTSPAQFGAPYINGSWLGQFYGAADATTLTANWWGGGGLGLSRSGNPKSLTALSYGLYTGTSIPVSSSLNGAVLTGTFTTLSQDIAPNPTTWNFIALACNSTNLTGSGRDHLNSCIKKFKYFPTRLSNAQLQTLTTP